MKVTELEQLSEMQSLGWIRRIHLWDRSWLKIRFPLLLVGLAGLLYAYTHFPHRGPEPVASRYQTLTITVQSTVKAKSAAEAFANLQYLNVSYEDPGIYWLLSQTIAAVKIFNPSFAPSEMFFYPLQFVMFSAALLLLSWRLLPLGISVFGFAAFWIAFKYNILYWSWDVYWAPALAVLVTLAFLLSVTSWPDRGRWPWIGAGCFGAFVGVLGLTRQDSGLIGQAAAAALLTILLFHVVVLRRQPEMARIHLRGALVVVCFLAGVTFMRICFLADVGVVQWIKPPQAPIRGNMEHGKWHNVYLGLGFNVPPYADPWSPYGVAWDDTVGAFHAVEEDPGARFGTAMYMPTLRKLVGKVFSDDPVFLLKSIIARTHYELSLVITDITQKVGRLRYLLLVYPLSIFSFIVWPGRRAADGLIYWVVALAALVPPVLTFPSPAYSTGITMAAFATPLFLIGSMLAASDSRDFFPIRQRRWIAGFIVLCLLIGSAAFASFALAAKTSNDRFLWNLLGEPDAFLQSVESDSWRVDRHFNHSLSTAQRKSVAAKFQQARGLVSGSPGGSVTQYPNASLRIVNVTRLSDQIVLFVESSTELNYGIFLLRPDGSNQVFYRKALDWSPSQSYVLIFNTGRLDAKLQSFTLALKEGTATFTTDPNIPIAKITFGASSGITLTDAPQLQPPKPKVGWNLLPRVTDSKKQALVLSRARDGSLDFPAVGWKPDGSTEMTPRDGALYIRSPRGRAAYATFYAPLEADRPGMLVFELRYQLISGRIHFGLLSDDLSHWLQTMNEDSVDGAELVKSVAFKVNKGDRLVPLVTNNRNDADMPSEYSIKALRCFFIPAEGQNPY